MKREKYWIRKVNLFGCRQCRCCGWILSWTLSLLSLWPLRCPLRNYWRENHTEERPLSSREQWARISSDTHSISSSSYSHSSSTVGWGDGKTCLMAVSWELDEWLIVNVQESICSTFTVVDGRPYTLLPPNTSPSYSTRMLCFSVINITNICLQFRHDDPVQRDQREKDPRREKRLPGLIF